MLYIVLIKYSKPSNARVDFYFYPKGTVKFSNIKSNLSGNSDYKLSLRQISPISVKQFWCNRVANILIAQKIVI